MPLSGNLVHYVVCVSHTVLVMMVSEHLTWSREYNKHTWDIFLRGLEGLSENMDSMWKSREKMSNEVNFLSSLDIHTFCIKYCFLDWRNLCTSYNELHFKMGNGRPVMGFCSAGKCIYIKSEFTGKPYIECNCTK